MEQGLGCYQRLPVCSVRTSEDGNRQKKEGVEC